MPILLSFLPPELKLKIAENCDPYDLLYLSHVSTEWRMIALEDVVWNVWFEMIGSGLKPPLDISSRMAMHRLQHVPKRVMVMLALKQFCIKCRVEFAPLIFLPTLQRICYGCHALYKEFHDVPVTEALHMYDLDAQDISELQVIHSEHVHYGKTQISTECDVVCLGQVEEIAIQKHGGKDAMLQHCRKIPRSHTKLICSVPSVLYPDWLVVVDGVVKFDREIPCVVCNEITRLDLRKSRKRAHIPQPPCGTSFPGPESRWNQHLDEHIFGHTGCSDNCRNTDMECIARCLNHRAVRNVKRRLKLKYI